MKNKVLVVAAHPDDEVLGMGGTIARHVHEGDSVYILFLGDGVSSRIGPKAESIDERKQYSENACKILGAQIIQFDKFPDNSFDSVSLIDIVKSVEKVKTQIKPDLIYTHHGGDLNVDHRISCQAVLTAFRPQPTETFTEVCCFEVNSSTEWGGVAGLLPFNPDTYVDISEHLDILISAYSCYSHEIRPEPHIRSIESLRFSALKRGREIGVEAAEAFMTLRRIIR